MGPVVDGPQNVDGVVVVDLLGLQNRRVESSPPGFDLPDDTLEEVEGRLLPERLVRDEGELGERCREVKPLEIKSLSLIVTQWLEILIKYFLRKQSKLMGKFKKSI